MARKSGIGDIGIILALIGGIILVVFGILRIVAIFVNEAQQLLDNTFDINLVGGAIGENGALISGIIAIVLGLIVIWAWKESKIQGGDMLVWGIVFIIIGLIGGSLGGLLILLGGILLVIDYLM